MRYGAPSDSLTPAGNVAVTPAGETSKSAPLGRAQVISLTLLQPKSSVLRQEENLPMMLQCCTGLRPCTCSCFLQLAVTEDTSLLCRQQRSLQRCCSRRRRAQTWCWRRACQKSPMQHPSALQLQRSAAASANALHAAAVTVCRAASEMLASRKPEASIATLYSGNGKVRQP